MHDLTGLVTILLIFGFLPWMAMRARADRRRQFQQVQTLSQEEQRALDEMWEVTRRMETRIANLERILDAEVAGWRARTPV